MKCEHCGSEMSLTYEIPRYAGEYERRYDCVDLECRVFVVDFVQTEPREEF